MIAAVAINVFEYCNMQRFKLSSWDNATFSCLHAFLTQLNPVCMQYAIEVEGAYWDLHHTINVYHAYSVVNTTWLYYLLEVSSMKYSRLEYSGRNT